MIKILNLLRQRRIKFPNRVFDAVVANFGFFTARRNIDSIVRHGMIARMHRVESNSHGISFRLCPLQLYKQSRFRFILRRPGNIVRAPMHFFHKRFIGRKFLHARSVLNRITHDQRHPVIICAVDRGGGFAQFDAGNRHLGYLVQRRIGNQLRVSRVRSSKQFKNVDARDFRKRRRGNRQNDQCSQHKRQ